VTTLLSNVSAPARLGLLSLSALLWLGCPSGSTGGTDGGLPSDPPQVTLGIPDTDAVGTTFRLNLSVSGCDTVKTLVLLDHDQPIKTVAYKGAPTPVELSFDEVPFNHQVAAQLLLSAKVTCGNGRTVTSDPQAARFLPVAEVFSLPSGEQVAPDLFFAEGSGAATTFVGCSEVNGARALVRVDTSGAIKAVQGSLPFACSLSSVFMDRNPASGTRWWYEPGVGAAAFDASLNRTSYFTGKVQSLVVTSNGDAVALITSSSGLTACGYVANSTAPNAPTAPTFCRQASGIPLTGPVLNGTTVSSAYFDIVNSQASSTSLNVEKFDYTNPAGATTKYQLALLPPYDPVHPSYPVVAFHPDGSTLYYGVALSNGQAQVLACSTQGPGCSGATLRWTSPSFAESPLLLLPYASGARLAVVTAHHVYFIRTDTGLAANPNAINPTGALVANGVQPGNGNDIYLLFGQSQTGLPLEIVGLDSAESGEVFRYGLLAGSVTVAIADDGQPWLRVGPKLVRPLPLSTYRQVH